MGLADQVINLAFDLGLGSIAVAAASAFGMGRHDLAAQELQRWMGSKAGGSKGGKSSS